MSTMEHRLAMALQGMLDIGVEFDDKRIGYVVVQIDRAALEEARAALAEWRDQPCDPRDGGRT